MAELLASSPPPLTPVNNENEPILNARKSSRDDTALATSPEMSTSDSSRVQSKLLHRRIVTMLESLRGRSGNGGVTPLPTSPRLSSSHMELKSQPITFGQLRQATTSSVPPPPPTVVEEVSSSKMLSARSYTDLSDRQTYHTNVTDNHSDFNPSTSIPINKSSPKHQTNRERSFYSPLLEQHNIAPRMKEQDESKQQEGEQQQQQPKPPLTVDEILATYYSKVKVPTTTETNLSSQPSSYLNSNMGFYIHPISLLLNEQNRNRPPPPSYSSSIANGHRPPPTSIYNFIFLNKFIFFLY